MEGSAEPKRIVPQSGTLRKRDSNIDQFSMKYRFKVSVLAILPLWEYGVVDYVRTDAASLVDLDCGVWWEVGTPQSHNPSVHVITPYSPCEQNGVTECASHHIRHVTNMMGLEPVTPRMFVHVQETCTALGQFLWMRAYEVYRFCPVD